jgi:THO complex subunit 4
VRHTDVSGPTPANIDRYVPGKGRRSRSPLPRRRGGRPPGERRERGERNGRGRGEGGGGGRRPRKTQEELDAEMEDYWTGGAKENGASETAPVAEPEGDVEMAE